MGIDLAKAIKSVNIAEELGEDLLQEIGVNLVELVESDDRSRKGWMDDQEDWLKLAAQVRSTKSFPWQNASNVKYPLMTVAATQFHARALPSLINSNEPVLVKVVGNDPDGQKLARAVRVRKYMSYQVMEEMDEWLDELDRLLLILPIIGLAYKKTYYSEVLGRPRSVLLLPREVIVNYHAQDYARARVTHVMYMQKNEIIEHQRSGLFIDFDIGDPQPIAEDKVRDETIGLVEGEQNEDDPHKLYEVHGWLDLDNDGYKEPYIITIHEETRKVLRIVARYNANTLSRNAKGEVQKIEAIEFFTPYKFIPDPNSAVYALGFGSLLGPINEAVNSLINQLIDAGTLSNLQGGFLARGMKIKGGVTSFKPGEWKIVNTTGADLKNSVFPMPVREPSGTLFNLLNLLIQSGERISSVTDMMVGENPGQNQPATTSMAVLEQGLKVFTGIYKRVFRNLKSEYQKLYYINSLHINENKYRDILDESVEEELAEIEGQASPEEMMAVRAQLEEQNKNAGKTDFSLEGINILPAADPNLVTEAQRIVKSNSLLEKLQMGLQLNPTVVTRRALEAEQHEDIDELMEIPQQQPSIEEKEFELELVKEERASIDSAVEAILKIAKAESLEEGTQIDQYRAVVEDLTKTVELERGANANSQGQSAGPQTPA